MNPDWMICPTCGTTYNEVTDTNQEMSQSLQNNSVNKSQRSTPFEYSFQFPNIKKQLCIIGIWVSLLLLIIGAIVINISVVNDAEADSEDRADADGMHQNGAIIFNIGVGILIIVLFTFSFIDADLNDFVRLGMLIAAGFLGLAFHLIGA